MRVSLNRRLDRIREHLLPAGSLAWRIDRLSPELKRAYQIWHEKADAIKFEYKKQGLNSYEALLRGECLGPPMPRDLRSALWPDGEGIRAITQSTTAEQAADIYQQVLEQGEAK